MLSSEIYKRSQEGEKLWGILIDPDKISIDQLSDFVIMANRSSCDYILVGGSLINHNFFQTYLKIIHELSSKKVILFPGNNQQISSQADAILLLSLISGRNPDLLIGQHVKTAFKLQKSNLEILPCGYMLIESDSITSAIYMSESLPIPKHKHDIAAATALAGVQLGLKFIYMDTGSGSIDPISSKMISTVKKTTKVPLFVGGGVKSQVQMIDCWKAGADIVVVGNYIENNFQKMYDFNKTTLAN